MTDTNQLRQVAWDVYASAALGMSMHPGTTRDKPNRMTVPEVAAIADAMLAERDRRFSAPNRVLLDAAVVLESGLTPNEYARKHGLGDFKDDDFIPRYPDMVSVDAIAQQAAKSYADLHDRITILMGERDRALAERDDARRGICNLLSWEDHHDKFCGSPAEYAKQRGWDCFKEDGK